MSGFGDPRLKNAQRLAFDADQALRKGDRATATALYAQAAPLEAAVAREVASDRPRVRGVIAVSAVTLWYKAGRYAEARLLAAEFLADPVVANVAEAELRELLARCEHQALPPPRIIHLSDLHFSGDVPATEVVPPRSPNAAPPVVMFVDTSVLLTLAHEFGHLLLNPTVTFPPPTRVFRTMRPVTARRPPSRRHRDVA